LPTTKKARTNNHHIFDVVVGKFLPTSLVHTFPFCRKITLTKEDATVSSCSSSSSKKSTLLAHKQQSKQQQQKQQQQKKQKKNSQYSAQQRHRHQSQSSTSPTPTTAPSTHSSSSAASSGSIHSLPLLPPRRVLLSPNKRLLLLLGALHRGQNCALVYQIFEAGPPYFRLIFYDVTVTFADACFSPNSRAIAMIPSALLSTVLELTLPRAKETKRTSTSSSSGLSPAGFLIQSRRGTYV
jgi:DNA mismatch repair ATPase MutL